MNVVGIHHNTMIRKNGILLNGVGSWGVIFLDFEGIEKYQEFQFEFDELISYQHNLNEKNIFFNTNLDIKLDSFAMIENEIKITASCFFHFQAYTDKIANIIIGEGDRKELILAKHFIGKQTFTFQKEVVFQFQNEPMYIEPPSVKLGKIQPFSGQGWFRIESGVELAVAYVDGQHIFREDFFRMDFVESWVWDLLQSSDELQISANLEYDSYHQDAQQLFYKFLMKISVECYREELLTVALAEAQPKSLPESTENLIDFIHYQTSLADFEIETEIPLTNGRIKEIIENRTSITQFQYHDSGNAILIVGELTGELEYWDEEYYLRKEPIKISFWRFVPGNPELDLNRCQLIPEVNHIRYSPGKALPWQKMMLQIHFELGIKCIQVGETDEGFISEP